MKQSYTKVFYDSHSAGSMSSAEEIIPLVLEYIQPESVVDVGCGRGVWLSVFKKMGIGDILGIDGNWVERNDLVIPPDKFITADLRNPPIIGRKFDLVVSLEVAEHIPQEHTETFIEFLTKLGDIVLFSAAIPGQGGTNHVNEQWQNYWAEIFLRHDFLTADCIRKRIWNNRRIEYWYIQNILMYAKSDYLRKNKKLSEAVDNTDLNFINIVHPGMFEGLARVYKTLFGLFPKPVVWILRRIFKLRI